MGKKNEILDLLFTKETLPPNLLIIIDMKIKHFEMSNKQPEHPNQWAYYEYYKKKHNLFQWGHLDSGPPIKGNPHHTYHFLYPGHHLCPIFLHQTLLYIFSQVYVFIP